MTSCCLPLFALFCLTATSCAHGPVERRPLLRPNPTAIDVSAPIENVHQCFRRFDAQDPPLTINRERLQIEWRESAVFAPPSIYKNPANAQDVYAHNFRFPLGDSAVYHIKDKPLPYIASFHIHITPLDAQKTRVEVNTIEPKVVAGKEMTLLSHGAYRDVHEDVAPTSIEEYTILVQVARCLGVADTLPPVTRLTGDPREE